MSTPDEYAQERSREQPETQEEPTERAARKLRTCARVLDALARELEEERPLRTRTRRGAVKRILSGVVADVEGLRLAIPD